jgi:hypothetical protein
MSDFVEQCRREWKRLGVPDPLAEEMAADLAADLSEAEAEGVSAEELLGSSVFDARSFAASWAAERGVIPESRPVRRRPIVLIAFTAVAAIAVIVATALLATGEPKVGVVASRTARSHLPSPPAPPGLFVRPGSRRIVLQTSAAEPVAWILLVLAIAALAFTAWLWSSRVRSKSRSVPT